MQIKKYNKDSDFIIWNNVNSFKSKIYKETLVRQLKGKGERKPEEFSYIHMVEGENSLLLRYPLTSMCPDVYTHTQKNETNK